MLVLSRKVEEKILIGNDIVITVVAVKGGKVRLGFDAPSELKILRDECLPTESTVFEEEAVESGSRESCQVSHG